MPPEPSPTEAAADPSMPGWKFVVATLIGLVGFTCVAVLVWVTVRSFI